MEHTHASLFSGIGGAELAAFIGCGLTKLREFAKELGLTKKKVA